MITDKELEEFQKICDAATEGPWNVVSDLPFFAICKDPNPPGINPYRIVQTQNQVNWKHSQWRGGIESFSDAQFIAAARTAVPRLIAEIKRLKEVAKEADDTYWRLVDSLKC